MDIAKRRVCDALYNMLQQMWCAIVNDDIGNIGSSGIIGGGAVGISVGIDIGSMNSKSNNGRIINMGWRT